MKITLEQYDDAVLRGFTAKHHNLTGFAEACYNDNTYNELKNVKTDEPDEHGMREWEITPSEWRAAQIEAIEYAMYLFDVNRN